MHVDLLTLYFITIGTLLASAGLTFWEHRTHPNRSRSLGILAAGFGTLAVGCICALFRADMPAAIGAPLSNLVILSGYLLVLNSVASLSGRHYRKRSVGLLAVMALIWLAAGVPGQDVVWKYVSALPIALVSALTAWELLRCDSMKTLKTRNFAIAVAGIHALIYFCRTFLLPWWVAVEGPSVQLLASNITMYEGVLYSVLLPMTLIKLIREETHAQLVRESQTDYLTRLGNRRWFFEQGARLVAASAGREPIAVLAFDLDQFKAINDRYGHHTGDLVLAAFATVARDALGPQVILARLGGEEFAALLAGDDARRAHQLGAAAA
ncbi:diguanylate cyclase domain-containing protein, partial [Achromobacter xylosoxidans]